MKLVVAAIAALVAACSAEARTLTIPFTLGAPISLPGIDPSIERVKWAYFQWSVTGHFHYEAYGLGFPVGDPMEEWWTDNSVEIIALVGQSYPLAGANVDLWGGFPSNTNGDRNTIYITDYDSSLTDQYGGSYFDNDLSNPLYGSPKLLPTSVQVNAIGYWPDLSMWSNFRFQNTALAVGTEPVPEPASWAMMVSGFGLIGGAMRYRRRKAVWSA